MTAFGPQSVNYTTTRPATDPVNSGIADTWFRDCTSVGQLDGTVPSASWYNVVTANLRTAVRSAGIPLDDSDDTMVWRAMQQAAAAATPNATGSVKGLVEIAAATETTNAAESGDTGARLAMNPKQMLNASTFDVTPDPAADRVWAKDSAAEEMRWLLLNDLIAAAVHNASNTTKGVVEIGTNNDIRDVVEFGSTGALTVLNPQRLYDVSDLSESADFSSDRVFFKDVSTGQMRWAPLVSIVPNASSTVAGKAEVATNNDIRDAVEFGSTGAPLLMNPRRMRDASTFDATPNAAADHVWAKDASAGEMRWLLLQDLMSAALPHADSSNTKGVVEIAGPNDIRDKLVTGATGAELVMSAEHMYEVSTFSDDIDYGNDRVWMRDDSAGEMRWMRVRDFATPSGAILMWTDSTPPDGYLECDGSAISRSTYSALFSVIGTRYGNGNGSSTFNLPDMRGEFPRGWDNGRNVDSGRGIGTDQKGTLVGIDIGGDGVWAASYSGTSGSSSRTAAGADSYSTSDYANMSIRGAIPDASNSLPGSSESSGYSGVVRPRNVALMFIIKY